VFWTTFPCLPILLFLFTALPEDYVGASASFLYKCIASRGGFLRQHGILVKSVNSFSRNDIIRQMFHMIITRLVKSNFLKSYWQWCWTSLKLLPLVLIKSFGISWSLYLSVGSFKAFMRSLFDFWTILELTLSLSSVFVLIYQHQFSPHDAMLARYMLRHRVSICQCCTAWNGSRRQRHTIAYRESSFLMPKISAKLKRRHPNGGAEWRWV